MLRCRAPGPATRLPAGLVEAVEDVGSRRTDSAVDALVEVALQVIVPARCTGWDVAHAIAARLPDAFIQDSVGTRFELARSV